jgi:hypothetical protein
MLGATTGPDRDQDQPGDDERQEAEEHSHRVDEPVQDQRAHVGRGGGEELIHGVISSAVAHVLDQLDHVAGVEHLTDEGDD